MSRTNHGLFLAVGMVALWLVSDVSVAAEPTDAARITIREFMFNPMQLTIKAGANVTWVNQDDDIHTVASDTGLFRSGALDTGNEFTFRFDKPGTYQVFCTLHPQMKATIVVE